MNKKVLAVIAILLALLIAWLGYKFLTRSTLEDSVTPAPSSSSPNSEQKLGDSSADSASQDATNATSNPNTSTQFETGLENLPRSLQGTEVDGDIIIDGTQNLVVTEGLKRLFDYFLSTLGEESAETIHARVEAYIKSHTPEPAASQAVEIYHQYVTYLQRLNAIQNKYGDLQMRATKSGEFDLSLARQRQQDIVNLRNELFESETIEAFFADDDELFEYNIAMIELAQNDNLTEEQRQAAKEDYLSRLPDSLIKQNAEQQANLEKLMQQTEALKKQGASDAELFAMRAKLVGVPAAERLAEVDAQNQDFDNRFEQYQTAKQQIMASNADEAEQQAQISALEGELFDEAEQKRLTGYAQLKELEASEQQ